MNIPKGYKQTELGLIPEDWEIRLFSQTFNIYPNNTYPRDCMNNSCGEVRNIHYGDVLIKYPTIVDVEKCSIPYLNENVKVKTQKFLQTGDIIIADTAEDDAVGKCVEIVNESNSKVVSGLHTFFCRPSILFATGWLGYYLNSSNYHNQLLPYITGIKVSSISKSSIQETKILVPSVSEQKAIAKALNDVDDLIAALDKKIAKKRLIKQGAMQQLLTGKKRLPGFTEEWKTICLKDIGDLYNGYAFKSEAYTATGQYKIVTIANVQNGRLTTVGCSTISIIPNDLQDYQQLKIGDILVSMTGNVGRVCIVDSEKCLLNQRVGLFRIKTSCRYDKLFIYNILNCSNFEDTMIDCGQGAAQSNISKKDIEGFEFTAPIDIREQQAIATILCDMDKEIANLETMRDKYRLIKSGMMQKLLTGQIRLKIE